MKQLTRFLLVLTFASAIVATTASSQGAAITVDELGNSIMYNGTAMPWSIQTEPFSGMATLTYQLPFPGVRGDVLLFEPNTPVPSPPSDLIRFDGNFNMYFFSDNLDGPPFDPADVGIPAPNAAAPVVSLFESGPEGNNGAYYNPTGGNPGDNSFGADYFFVSDGVAPEPTTLALAGLSGLLLIRRRRSQRIAISG